MSIVGMFAHDEPFFRSERSGLEQNSIRDTHLANIVQQRTTTDMNQFALGHSQKPGKLDSPLGHAPAMPLSFFVAQIKRARPTLDGRIVGLDEIGIGALEVSK